ncbi:MAG: TIGR04282 family arsenosugar biosynthesis glycosyltransferase [Bacteroidetes bacterium]|nr:TIGR04282 family arsenosugar biosynthesis glycosyltransferase [Bacteroidota bacterium]
MPKSCIILFAKPPVKGLVKTRLAADLGNEITLEIYQQLLQIAVYQASKSLGDLVIFWSEKNFDSTTYSKFPFQIQDGKNLGKRMINAFNWAFENGYKKVIIMGSDCPELNAEIINKGFSALSKADVVFGKAEDGGYYLIGMNRLHEPILDFKEWSHSQVLENALRVAQEMNLKVESLPVLSDIDNVRDLRKFPQFASYVRE